MGQLKFSGRLSKQAGCFGTYCILNRTVLDNLTYMIKRTDWRSCCWRQGSYSTSCPNRTAVPGGFTSIADCRNCCGYMPGREHRGHPTAALPHPGRPQWLLLALRMPQRLNQTRCHNPEHDATHLDLTQLPPKCSSLWGKCFRRPKT